MLASHTRQIDRRAARKIEHRPLRYGAAELLARGIREGEVSRREHPPVIADPRRDAVIRVLPGAAVQLEGHARKYPRMVLPVERIDAESLPVGVEPRRIEHGAAQCRHRRTQRKIDFLRFYAVGINTFLCHNLSVSRSSVPTVPATGVCSAGRTVSGRATPPVHPAAGAAKGYDRVPLRGRRAGFRPVGQTIRPIRRALRAPLSGKDTKSRAQKRI